MTRPAPVFTKVDLSTLDAQFDTTARLIKALPVGLDRSKKAAGLIASGVADAKTEINRQVAIFTNEETGYVTYIKQLHADSKPAAASLIDSVSKLQAKWDDRLFQTMPALQKKLHENADSAHDWGKALTAHQGFRAGAQWNEKRAAEVLGKEQAEALQKHYIAGRAPMISLTADIKTFVIKLDEFAKRGDDCLKAAMALKTKSAGIAKDFLADIKSLLDDAKTKAGDCETHRDNHVPNMQKFVVLCNTKKNLIDRADYAVAEKNLQKFDLTIKNDKTYLKTLETALNNLGTRTKAAPPPDGALSQMQAISKVLQGMAGDIKQLQTGRDAFAKKMADAKAASKF